MSNPTQASCMPTGELLRDLDVASLLGVSRRTLQHWRTNLKGPPWIALGDTPHSPIRYPLDGLRAWARARLRQAPAARRG